MVTATGIAPAAHAFTFELGLPVELSWWNARWNAPPLPIDALHCNTRVLAIRIVPWIVDIAAQAATPRIAYPRGRGIACPILSLLCHEKEVSGKEEDETYSLEVRDNFRAPYFGSSEDQR